MKHMMELVVKSSHLLSIVGATGRPMDQLRILEMSLNKEDKMLEKTKLVIIKLDKLYIVLPSTMTKIEVRMRNIVINMRP